MHGSRIPTKQYLKTLVPQLLNAAQYQIALNWREKESPSLRGWCSRVEEIYNLEHLRFRDEEKWEEFEERWEKWKRLKYTMGFADAMGI